DLVNPSQDGGQVGAGTTCWVEHNNTRVRDPGLDSKVDAQVVVGTSHLVICNLFGGIPDTKLIPQNLVKARQEWLVEVLNRPTLKLALEFVAAYPHQEPADRVEMA